jgi:beta-glucosidase
MNERVKQGHADLIFIGDSITQGWEAAGKDVWAKYYEKRNAVNLGISGDRTQHVLWRLEHGNIEGIHPKLAVIMIGTNNLTLNSHQEMLEGLKMLVQAVQQRQPNTGIVLCGLLPRVKKEKEIAELNLSIAQLAGDLSVQYADPGKIFLRNNGSLEETLFSDGLHPNAEG